MLTRLKIRGFKNLADVDVSFGPFTCVAGANGVGKSNLFDAIIFLSALADKTLMDAATSVRDEHGRSTDVRALFMSFGDKYVSEMSFEAEILVPSEGYDELRQKASATTTFLRYQLVLGYRDADEHGATERLEVLREELTHIKLGDASSHLRFRHDSEWRKSVLKGKRSGVAFISTEGKAPAGRVVKLHQDGSAGRPRKLLAASLPRTVLSSVNAAESRTALLARREMQSWRLLQLEPSAMRRSDPFNAPTRIGKDGSHLASTLYHLGLLEGARAKRKGNEPAVYARVANRLAELTRDVRRVTIDRDDRRELLTLQVIDHGQRLHAARALSDGTLRFLALTILELDPEDQGLLCFEEPENGIHPERIAVMLQLLNDLAVDTSERVSIDNPLRQVLVNTHSPAVVAAVHDDDLLIAEPYEIVVDGAPAQAVRFTWLADTWRCRVDQAATTVARGRLGAYLNPLSFVPSLANGADDEPPRSGSRRQRRVSEREDLQMLLPHFSDE